MSKVLKNVIKCQWSVHKVYIDFCKRYVLAKRSLFPYNIFRELNDSTVLVVLSFYQDNKHVNINIFQRISVLWYWTQSSKALQFLYEKFFIFESFPSRIWKMMSIWKLIKVNSNCIIKFEKQLRQMATKVIILLNCCFKHDIQ